MAKAAKEEGEEEAQVAIQIEIAKEEALEKASFEPKLLYSEHRIVCAVAAAGGWNAFNPKNLSICYYCGQKPVISSKSLFLPVCSAHAPH